MTPVPRPTSSSDSSSGCRRVPGRKFVFAHILLPHPPYIFDAEGDMVTRPVVNRTPEWQLYADQLTFIDGQMRSVMETLLAGPDETDPIHCRMSDGARPSLQSARGGIPPSVFTGVTPTTANSRREVPLFCDRDRS